MTDRRTVTERVRYWCDESLFFTCDKPRCDVPGCEHPGQLTWGGCAKPLEHIHLCLDHDIALNVSLMHMVGRYKPQALSAYKRRVKRWAGNHD